jgi:hypothetical protein
MWFHEIFHTNGRPYDEQEVTFIKEIIAGKNQAGR